MAEQDLARGLLKAALRRWLHSHLREVGSYAKNLGVPTKEVTRFLASLLKELVEDILLAQH